MRILHVLDHSAPLHSGYTFRTLAILTHQRALGWTTAHVTSAKHTGALQSEEAAEGFTFYRTLPTGALMERAPLLGQFAIVRGLARRLQELVPEVGPDILHAHSPCLNGLAALAVARRRRIPVVYELRALWEDGAVSHGTTSRWGGRYWASRILETHVLRRADAVTTICEGLRRDIVRRGIPEGRVTVIPNAVDVVRFTAAGVPDSTLTAALGLSGMRTLGFIGSFYRYEGLSLLLAAFPRMLRQRGDLRLLLVGGGPEEETLRAQARAAGIADKVIFAGSVPHDRVDRYYAMADVFVYPRQSVRLTELVTPLKPLEAMAQGRLVVASDVGGHRELIRHGETGFLFRAGDVESLVGTVLQVLERDDLARAVRSSARHYVETERAWPASVARYAPVYAGVLGHPPGVTLSTSPDAGHDSVAQHAYTSPAVLLRQKPRGPQSP